MSPLDMSPEAVSERLREMSRLSDLTATERLAAKVDVSPAAVTRRLRRQSALRRACLTWKRLGEEGGVADLPGR